jgi:MoxR-like ATPase
MMQTSTFNPSSSEATLQRSKIALVKQEIAKVIVGQELLLDRLLVALLVQGHVLLEGVPGLAKTKTLTCLSSAISGQMNRIQFTPDLLPADIIGTEIYRPQTGEFLVRRGPVFSNLLLADEINRAPAKVQSALLEAMAEHHVSIGGTRIPLPKPFMVLATQNPIEQTGTYELPEAQLDRFLMKLTVGYPSFEEELKILTRHSVASDTFIPDSIDANSSLRQPASSLINPVLSSAEIMAESALCEQIFVDARIDTYIVRLVQATRNSAEYGLKNSIAWGASPRASIALKGCTKALALLRGRNYVTPDDVKELAPDILRHRIILSFDSEGDGVTTDEIIQKLLGKVPVP